MYTFTKSHDRRIPNVGVGVRVGVSPVEFQLYGRRYVIGILVSYWLEIVNPIGTP